MNYPFRLWGFGEDVALRGLLEVDRFFDDARCFDFVHDLLKGWCKSRGPLRPEDHVVPGVPLLMMYERTDDSVFLDAAIDLGALYERFGIHDGIPVHRPDLHPWERTIWVDCMYMDAPFLLRLWRTTGQRRWLDLGLQHVTSYAAVLREPTTGLFWHGYDTGTREHSACLWGRGNGWALLGLIETLAVLPIEHHLHSPLQDMLVAQVRSIASLQDSTGSWRTILDDAEAPLENSTAAIFAASLQQAGRLSLLPERLLESSDVPGVIARATAAMYEEVGADGDFPVSSATPIGERATYVSQTHGVYPWGQGPVLLSASESLLARTLRGVEPS